MFSLFFIRRPVFACVLSILIVIVGVVAFRRLPVAQYPQITPPVIQVTASYPGASAQVVADTVASPVEQEVNGVESALYMESTSSSDGGYVLRVTFAVGTDIDIANVLVQNRVATAFAKLPEEVKRLGVTTKKVSSNIVAVIALSPKDRASPGEFNDLYLSNYLTINVSERMKRIPGVGDISTFPAKDYGMRVWLNPELLKARSLTTVDVVNALREQNVQVAAGIVGQPPVPAGQDFQYTVTTLGRLVSEEQFENVIVRASEGRLVRLKDVARIELGARSYDTQAMYEGGPGAIMVVYQSPTGNSVEVAAAVRRLVEQVRTELPAGVDAKVTYDTSEFVDAAIHEVYKTLGEAVVLVVLVMLLFLGSLRTTLIPILTIPVALIGTFAAMAVLGFTVNMLTLFGLILAIGIVVDDAIVVVENVERNMSEHHLGPKAATERAMNEVFGAVVAISLVLMSVFVPTAALPGITGQLYRQFALTIAASTALSALNALTLSPALCGVILRAHEPGRRPTLFVRGFNAVFGAITAVYGWIVRTSVHKAVIVFTLAAFVGVLLFTGWITSRVPGGFLPTEDQGFVITEVWMPDAASQERTMEVAHRVTELWKTVEGARTTVAIQGLSLINGSGSSYAVMFTTLKDWKERPGRDQFMVLRDAMAKFSQIQEAIVFCYVRPPIDGLGNASGFDMRLQDRGGMGADALQQLAREMVTEASGQSKLRNVTSGYKAGIPQLFANVDREKAKKLGVSLQDVFGTLQAYMGSVYVNDINRFGRTWQVSVQADSRFRAAAEDIRRLQVRNAAGEMVPLSTFTAVNESMGPDRVKRYNLYPAATINGEPAPGASSGESLQIMEEMFEAKKPQGFGYEWSSMAYQEKSVGGQGRLVFILALVVVYLILAAQYESWLTPLAVVISVPLSVVGAMAYTQWRGMDNNVYTQIGLVLLVGLGAKNAILIVEFARENRARGLGIIESAVQSAKQRLRPILMTSLAFIAGVYPLVASTGAGSAGRRALGTAVFGGMIGNTLLGLLFTPMLYVLVQAISELIFGKPKTHSTDDSPPMHPLTEAPAGT